MLHWLGIACFGIAVAGIVYLLARMAEGFYRGAIAGWRARACKLGRHAKFLERRTENICWYDSKEAIQKWNTRAWYRCPYCKERVSDYLPD